MAAVAPLTPLFAAADCIVRYGVTVIHKEFAMRFAAWTFGLVGLLAYIEYGCRRAR